MRRISKLMLAVCTMLVLFTESLAEIVPIPVDKVVMDEVNEAYYKGDYEYEDPSLHVTIEEGIFHDTAYLVARIKIADPTQLRSYVTGTNSNQIYNGAQYATELADRVNAVLAISGDVTNLDKKRSGTKNGKHITRNYVTYVANANPDSKTGLGALDILIIDDKGDLTIIPRCTEADIDAFEGNIVSTYSFGPAVVLNGEQMTDFSYRATAYGAKKKAQRICFGQTGPLEYVAVYSAGPDQKRTTDGKKCKGLTMDEFSELVYSQGDVIQAYNLDGGTSTWMVFHGERMNAFGNRSKNAIADIIYFASAWQEETKEEAEE